MVHYFDRSRFIMGGGNGGGKQKVVIKLSLENAQKRKKALLTAARIDGVMSLLVVDGDKIEVLGDGFDAVALACLLRKKVGYAYLISPTGIWEEGYSDDDGTSSSTDSLQSPISICRCFPV